MGEDPIKRDGSSSFILIMIIMLFVFTIFFFAYSSFGKFNWSDVDLSLPKFKYNSSTWGDGFAADCLDSSSNYPCTSNLTSKGHPREHVDFGESLDDLVKTLKDGLAISPNPLWISYQFKDLSWNKGKNKFRKTGFVNQEDQNNIFEEIMQLDCGKEALRDLNVLAEQVRLTVSADLLTKNKNVPMSVCVKGIREELQTAKSFVIILGHFADRSQQEACKVHVTSFYPQVEEMQSFELKVLDYGNISDKLVTLLTRLLVSGWSKWSKFGKSVNKSPTYAQVLKMNLG